jgi:hypothetical protein
MAGSERGERRGRSRTPAATGPAALPGPDAPFRLGTPPGPMRALDRLVTAYAALASIPLALGVARGVPGCAPQLALTAAVVLFALAFGRLTRNTRSRPLLLLRLAYVPLLFLFFYDQTAVIWPVLHGASFDPLIAGFDQAVFGGQPALTFSAAVSSRALSELFCLAYFSYYFFTPAVLIAILARHGYERAEESAFAASLCFFACYATFWLFPTTGPHFYFPPHAGPALYRGYVFNHLLFFLTSRGEVPAGAFPSSHIAVAVLLTIRARRDAPALFPVLLPLTLLILPAVVYLRAHYVADVLTGVPTGLLFAWIADPVRTALESRTRAPGQAGRSFHRTS